MQGRWRGEGECRLRSTWTEPDARLGDGGEEVSRVVLRLSEQVEVTFTPMTSKESGLQGELMSLDWFMSALRLPA